MQTDPVLLAAATERGTDDFKTNVRYSDNPYEIASEQQAWNAGWAAAYFEAPERQYMFTVSYRNGSAGILQSRAKTEHEAWQQILEELPGEQRAAIVSHVRF